MGKSVWKSFAPPKAPEPTPTKRPGKQARKAASRAKKRAEIAAGLRPPPKPKSGKSVAATFYASREWKQLRYATLVKHGARCMCCGVSAADGARINVDHIQPISKAWDRRLDPSNLQVLCGSCNAGKAAWDQTDWRPQPATLIPRVPTDDEIHRNNPLRYH